MPSHTWNRLGRWGDSVRANLQAWHSDQKASIGEGIAIYPAHDLHMLVFAACMDGQGAIAIQAAKDYAKLTKSSMYQVLSLIRFGRFDEVLELKTRPDEVIDAAVWDFGQGYAKLHSKDKAAADEYLKRLRETALTSNAVFRFHPAHNLLGTLAWILDGEKNRTHNDKEEAVISFKRAVAFEDAMIYDEPEPLPFAARHWLGAELLETEQYAEAEHVYREDLRRHPHNGWSLYGLNAALIAQGKPFDDAARDFDSSWARSDTWIRGSRF
jgi:tetratricopeptide (TPR) repeat protein